VPAWNTSPLGVKCSIISAGPPIAPTGNPPPTIFDLVEDQQRSPILGDVPERLQIAVLGHHDAGVAQHRFGEDRGDLVAVGLERLVDRVEVVERHREGVLGELLGDAVRAGAVVLDGALDERRLLGAVVAALHHDDLVPTGVPAGQPNRRNGRLGTGVDEAGHLDARDVAGDELGEVDLDLGRRAVHRPLADRRLDRRLHRVRQVVAVQQRAVAVHEVQVAVAVGVDDVAAVAPLDEEGIGADRPHRRVDAAGNRRQRTVVQVARAVVVHGRRVALARKVSTEASERAAPNATEVTLSDAEKSCEKGVRRGRGSHPRADRENGQTEAEATDRRSRSGTGRR